jgi:hypothetical protein
MKIQAGQSSIPPAFPAPNDQAANTDDWSGIMYNELRRRVPSDLHASALLPLFNSLTRQEQAICLFNEEGFQTHLSKAEKSLRSMGLYPSDSTNSVSLDHSGPSVGSSPPSPKRSVAMALEEKWNKDSIADLLPLMSQLDMYVYCTF